MTNSSFSSGSYSYASKDKQWAAYDSLPPSIRRALQDAAFNYAAYPIKRRFEAGSNTAKDFVKKIAQWDRDQIKRDRKRVWKVR